MNLEKVKEALAEYKNLLTFEKEGDYAIIRLKKFVPKEKWDQINEAILGKVKGKYVGGIGKNVHWRVPAEKSSLHDSLRQAIELLMKVEKELEKK